MRYIGNCYKKGVFILEFMELKLYRRVFSRVGFALLVMVSITVALQLVGYRVFVQEMQNEWFRFMLMVLPQYMLAMPLAALLMRKMQPQLIERKPLSAGKFTLVVFVCIAIMYAGSLLGSGINMIIQAITQNDMTKVIENLIMGSSVWANLVFVVLLAPIAEELFYRRLLIPKLLPFGEKPAIILSGLAFGLIHGNLSQFFYAFGLGLAFGYVFVKTGKVIYTIILHIFINFLGSVVSVAVINAGLIATGLYGLVMICLTITGIVIFFVNKKRIIMSRGIFGIPKGKGAVFLNVGTILFFIGCAALFVFSTLAMFAS